jgi:hypothetical protein
MNIMSNEITRRAMIASAGLGAVLGAAGTAAAQDAPATASAAVLVVGVSCSPRKGKSTATAMAAALRAEKGVDPRITTELVDLGACG